MKQKKVPSLVVVLGGCAYQYDSKYSDTRIVDMDNFQEGGEIYNFPKNVGFEALVKKAKIQKYVRFV